MHNKYKTRANTATLKSLGKNMGFQPPANCEEEEEEVGPAPDGFWGNAEGAAGKGSRNEEAEGGREAAPPCRVGQVKEKRAQGPQK